MAKKDSGQPHDTKALLAKIAALETEGLALLDENDRLKAEIAALQQGTEIINSARVVARSAKPVAIEFPVFELGGKAYRFKAHGFRIDRRNILALDAATDPVLCAMIIEKYPGLVQVI